MAKPRVWVVRGGYGNELANQVKDKGHVATGWLVGDVSAIGTREELRRMLEAAQPGLATTRSVGQLFRFAKEIQVGDYILTPEAATSEVHVSRCTGPYKYDPSVFGSRYPHVRPVHYLRAVPRGDFPLIGNTLASMLTVFRVDVLLPYLEVSLKD